MGKKPQLDPTKTCIGVCTKPSKYLYKDICLNCAQQMRRRAQGVKPRKILTPEERVIAKKVWEERARRKRGQKPFQKADLKKRAAYKKEWAQKNKERVRELRKANPNTKLGKKKDYQKNKAAYVTRAYNRYLTRKGQTLPNVTYKDLQVFYDAAKEITAHTGIKHNVDHIIPLKHEAVCGLNVPWNLQILTEFENKSKNNSFDFTNENLGWKNA